MEKESWHLSKSVPITFIVAVGLQTIALVWYVSSLDSNVETNAREIARHEIRLDKLDTQAAELSVMNARIDENIKAIRKTLENMAKRD